MAGAMAVLLWPLVTLAAADTMRQVPLQASLALASIGAANSTLIDRCTSETFSSLEVFGSKIIDISAIPRENYTATIEEDDGLPDKQVDNLNFCNVTVTYTHPGRDDTINIAICLPLSNWNGRFQGSGGGGWTTGVGANEIAPVTAQGFAVASTDGGHPPHIMAAPWALDSPGNVNLGLLQDFASLALGDLAGFGKSVTEMYYGEAVRYSYWNGCSTGGRQGLMLAQRYPDAYDGILALAPAINWAHLIMAGHWTQHLMNRLNYYPFPCEIQAISNASIAACDELDGLKDGIISNIGLCDFDATTLIGQTFSCNGDEKQYTPEATEIVQKAWEGPIDPTGKKWWYGIPRGTPFSVRGTGLGTTTCTNESQSSCTGVPFGIPEEWVSLFLEKNPEYDTRKMTDEEYFSFFHQSIQEYESIIGTRDPDLSAFKKHGGKMITFHGLNDHLIMPNGSSEYYSRVLELDPKAHDFYRLYEAPGVFHCSGGPGPLPEDPLKALMEWVEEGVVPETLKAVSQTGDGTVRELCSYPKRQVYVGGDPKKRGSFECV